MHDIPEAATVKPPQQNSTSPILPEGYLLRDYKIIKMLGHGGFGITYLAQEVITDKLVVIKENYPTEVSFRDMASLTVGPLTDKHKETYDWALTRFLDEAKTLSSLSHPNIVPIRYAFKALGTAYYVMPHVEGTDLHKAAPAPDNITAEWLLPVLEKILSALGYLHAQGLIHRDIKPNNILLREDGEPILIDFGTARALESTHSHSHIGTPGYMPLEQLSAGGKRGPWTDFYALGATCYHLITGEIPPHSLDRIEEDEYLPLAGNPSLARRFPEHVLSSIDKALRMNRHERWQSAQEWLEALKMQHAIPSPAPSHQPQTKNKVSAASPQKSSKHTFKFSKKLKAKIAILLCLLFIISGYTVGIPLATEYNLALLLRVYLSFPGIDVNGPIFDNSPPLHRSAFKGSTECVRVLLKMPGIDVNQTDMFGNTPLNFAAENGNTECVRLLLAAPGIDVNKADENGYTPLILAAKNGHTECVRLLLTAPGININQANQYDATPLSEAAKNGHTECVRLLLTAPGININQANQYGATPLFWAADQGHAECVRLLLTAPGIDVNMAGLWGSPPLYQAALMDRTECVRLLLAAPGIDVNKADENGNTPLSAATGKGHTECIRLLLAAPGIDINKASSNGNTPLFWAAFKGHTECVRLLLAAPGIDVNKKNKDGRTPLYMAEFYHHTACANLIRAAGGRR